MKRNIAIQTPSKLQIRNDQLIIIQEGLERGSVPMEDIGLIILEHPQISLSHAVLSKSMENKIAFICCDELYHPSGMLLNLNSHHLQRRLFEDQISCSEPVKKQIWQQIIRKKLQNQARILAFNGKDALFLEELSKKVRSGDADNLEAQGASFYWRHLFDEPIQRERGGKGINALLNYGYAILRAMTARSLSAAGLLCTWGVQHKNQYNAYCLADDLMEPYRPMVDLIVVQITKNEVPEELNTEIKSLFWTLSGIDVETPKGIRPLGLALSESSASLQQFFSGKTKELKLGDVKLPSS